MTLVWAYRFIQIWEEDLGNVFRRLYFEYIDKYSHLFKKEPMKTESIGQNIPFSGRKRSLIEDARRERESSSSSPGPSRCGDSFVFEEEKCGKVTLNVLFALRNEENAGFLKAGKVFEVSHFIWSI